MIILITLLTIDLLVLFIVGVIIYKDTTINSSKK